MFFLGCTASLIFSMSLPGFCLLFGDMIDSVGSNDGFSMLGVQAKWMIIIGSIGFVFSFTFISSLNIFAENIAFKIKIEYFR